MNSSGESSRALQQVLGMFSHEDKGIQNYHFGSSQMQFRALSPIMGHETGRQPSETMRSENTFFDVNKKIFPLSFHKEIILNCLFYFFQLESLLHFGFASISAVTAFQGSA